MRVTLTYFAQVRRLAGVEGETVELPEGARVLAAVRTAAAAAAFGPVVFDGAGNLQPVILPVVNGVPAAPDQPLRDGDQLSLFSPVAGG